MSPRFCLATGHVIVHLYLLVIVRACSVAWPRIDVQPNGPTVGQKANAWLNARLGLPTPPRFV